VLPFLGGDVECMQRDGSPSAPLLSCRQSDLLSVVMPQQHTEQDGPLAGHVRQGRRRFLPPLAATGVLHLGDWVRDDLPDLLWPILLASHSGNDAVRAFVRWQKAVQGDLIAAIEPKLLSEGLDGRLSSLDRFVAACPDAQDIVVTRAHELQMLPAEIMALFAAFPERPAPWLFPTELRSPSQTDIDFLGHALIEVLHDGHRESVVKCISIWSAVQAGMFSADETTINLLKTYPLDSAKRSLADTVVRASWGSMRAAKLAMDASWLDEATRWAKVFWDFNSRTTRCMRRRDLPHSQSDADDGTPLSESGGAHESDSGEVEHVQPVANSRQQSAKDLVLSYVEAVETSPANLYAPERQEVHAGLVLRAGREVIAILGTPELWSSEHGSHVGRMLVELRIYLSWMAIQDASIYRQFQEYGAGKAKLYSLIAEELPEDVRTPVVQESIDLMSRLSRNDSVLDHRVVDTRDSFADGKSLRAMADECGLTDLYRHVYMTASGVAHSEWWSVEMHSMERCFNILHRGHLIPRLSLPIGGSEELADAWLDSLYTLIQVSLDILEVDPTSIQSAFGWIDGTEEDDGSFASASPET
jgi:hypothetical protein